MKVKICCISDTHGKHRELDIEACDILLHAGDCTGLGQKYETADFLEWFQSLPMATFKVFIAGNHERGWQKKPAWLRARLRTLRNGTYYLEDSGINLMGIKIWGCPWQPEFNGWEFNLPRGSALAEKYALIPWDTNILISHGPPYGVMDRIPQQYERAGEDPNVGCKDLLHYVKKDQKDLEYHVFGHIHIDDREEIVPVEVEIESCNYGDRPFFVKCINAAVVDNHYDVIVKPYYFEYET